MKKLEDEIYLKTAGLAIKIIFVKTYELIYKDSLKKSILKNYKNFLSNELLQITDLTIRIKYKNNFILKSGKVDSALNFFFQEISEKLIETYYFLSLDQFNTLLTFVLRKVLLRNNGFIFHCASVICKNSLFILSGKAGSGKSTALKLLKKRYVPFSDDTIIIRNIENGFFAFQCPLIEKNYVNKNSELKYAIDRIYILRKSRVFNIRPVADKNLIFQKLIAQTSLNFFLFDKSDKYSNNQILSNLKKFIDSEDFYYLYFARNRYKLIKLIENSISREI